MRRLLPLLLIITLTACAQPAPAPTSDPAVAATAYAAPIECPGDFSDSRSGEDLTVYESPEQARDSLTLPPAGSPTHRYETADSIVFIYYEGDRKTGEVTVMNINGGWKFTNVMQCTQDRLDAEGTYAATYTVAAATAAAQPLTCPAEMISTEAEIAEGSGYPSPEEARDAFILDQLLPLAEPLTYSHRTSDSVIYVYTDAQGSKVAQINARLMSWGLWVVGGMDRCAP